MVQERWALRRPLESALVTDPNGDRRCYFAGHLLDHVRALEEDEVAVPVDLIRYLCPELRDIIRTQPLPAPPEPPTAEEWAEAVRNLLAHSVGGFHAERALLARAERAKGGAPVSPMVIPDRDADGGGGER